MKFRLYAEYPTDENLKNLSCLSSPADVIVAAHSLDEFSGLQEKIKDISPYVGKVGYWPVLDKKEGYWISPYSDPVALDRIFGEIEKKAQDSPLLVMLDLERPLVAHGIKTTLKGLNGFRKKKRKIKEFIRSSKDKGIEVVSAESNTFFVPEAVQRLEGIAYDPNEVDYEKVKMVYTSIGKFAGNIGHVVAKHMLKREVRKGVEKYGDKFGIGIGCLSTGVLGYEPLMTPEEFEEDIITAEEAGVKNAYVFDVKGLNPKFSEKIKKHSS